MHRAPIPSTLSRQQMAPTASLGTAHVNADATAAAQICVASGMHTPFQTEQVVDLPAEPSAARPISGRLFPDTAKGHMAMVCCFNRDTHMSSLSWHVIFELACDVDAQHGRITLYMQHCCIGPDPKNIVCCWHCTQTRHALSSGCDLIKHF